MCCRYGAFVCLTRVGLAAPTYFARCVSFLARSGFLLIRSGSSRLALLCWPAVAASTYAFCGSLMKEGLKSQLQKRRIGSLVWVGYHW